MEKVIRVVRLKDNANDAAFWMLKTPRERLEAIEFLREQYIKTLPNAQQRFQRVCRIVGKASR